MVSSIFSSTEPVLRLIALVTLKGYQDAKKGKELYIEDLAEYLVKLKTNDVDISRIALSRSLDKYWSEDVAQFVSEGIVFGFLTQKSPLRFNERCVAVCRKAIEGYVEDDESLRPLVQLAEGILELEPIEAIAA
ncbi:MAG TPA: hypothetical protein DC054_09170 [Blastocatellia bacterium]|nr:hypothetical protein [Blastocatellia bacterium]